MRGMRAHVRLRKARDGGGELHTGLDEIDRLHNASRGHAYDGAEKLAYKRGERSDDGSGKRTGHASEGELEVLWQGGSFRGLRHDAVGVRGADRESGESAGSVRVRMRTRVGRATEAM